MLILIKRSLHFSSSTRWSPSALIAQFQNIQCSNRCHLYCGTVKVSGCRSVHLCCGPMNVSGCRSVSDRRQWTAIAVLSLVLFIIILLFFILWPACWPVSRILSALTVVSTAIHQSVITEITGRSWKRKHQPSNLTTVTVFLWIGDCSISSRRLCIWRKHSIVVHVIQYMMA